MPVHSRSEALQGIASAGIGDLGEFSRLVVQKPLYPYQLESGRGIFRHVGDGSLRDPEFVLMMSRQAGKNELSAQAEAWMMNRYRKAGGSIVKAAPTFKPQIITSMERLKHTLNNWWNRGRWKSRFNYMISMERASTFFFSADEQANVVSATASLIMEVDEAQDVDEVKYNKDFVPMRATTNAPVVYYGTAWTEDTLLARKRAYAEELQKSDGIRRVFYYPWWEVAKYNEKYGFFIESEKSQLGETHPIYLTQYCLKEISATGGLFNRDQLMMMKGDHQRQKSRIGNFTYVMGIDIAGESEQGMDEFLRQIKPRQDSTVITIARLDFSVWTPQIPFPQVQIVDHYWWTGRNHSTQYNDLTEIISAWNPRKIVVDGGGVGAGIASFLKLKFGNRVEVFAPNHVTVSQTGYHLLSLVNQGNFKMYSETTSKSPRRPEPSPPSGIMGADGMSPEAREFWFEMEKAQRQLTESKRIRFFVPETMGHDDFVKSAALCAWATTLVPGGVQSGEEYILNRGSG